MSRMKKNKALIVATVPSMIGLFNMNNIRLLLDMGYDVHVACNFNDDTAWPKKKNIAFIKSLREEGIFYHNIDFCREPQNFKKIIRSFKQLNKLVKEEGFSFVHCHAPVAGVVSRLVCNKHGVRVLYTAHGFHFYNGAPIINWLIYFPVEWTLSWITDVLITINREDYQRAQKVFHAKSTKYITGVGIDTKKFNSKLIDRDKKRTEIGVGKDDLMYLSVGELSGRKNHESVLRALSKINNPKIKYYIAGDGEKKQELIQFAKEKKLNVNILGYRDDISELLQAADLFLLPSKQEGLPVALMEAMASKTAIVCSDIRGNRDLIHKYIYKTEEELFRILQGFTSRKVLARQMEAVIKENYQTIVQYDIGAVRNKLEAIYSENGGGGFQVPL